MKKKYDAVKMLIVQRNGAFGEKRLLTSFVCSFKQLLFSNNPPLSDCSRSDGSHHLRPRRSQAIPEELKINYLSKMQKIFVLVFGRERLFISTDIF